MLSKFIRSDIEPILRAWEEFAETLYSADDMDKSGLRDHAREMLLAIADDLPIPLDSDPAAFELKVFGLIAIFAYAFFKFGWSYRLFNYCTILFGAIPMLDEAKADPARAMEAAERTIRMNIIAASHFNMGLRAIFYSIGYLGWFVSPWIFMIATVLVFIVLLRRQFFSEARLALLNGSDR